jgi:hypothetical protein
MSQLFTNLPTQDAPPRQGGTPRRRYTPERFEQVAVPVAVIAPEEHLKQLAQKPRRCLHCADNFPSEGPGHRICDDCKQLPVWGTPNDFSVSAAF